MRAIQSQIARLVTHFTARPSPSLRLPPLRPTTTSSSNFYYNILFQHPLQLPASNHLLFKQKPLPTTTSSVNSTTSHFRHFGRINLFSFPKRFNPRTIFNTSHLHHPLSPTPPTFITLSLHRYKLIPIITASMGKKGGNKTKWMSLDSIVVSPQAGMYSYLVDYIIF